MSFVLSLFGQLRDCVMATSCMFKFLGRPAIAALGLVAVSLGAPAASAAEPWPAEIQASYRIQFNGIEIGQFTFNSSVHERTYSASANADVSALLGFVRWNGATRASGALAGNAPRPSGFSFDFRNS